MGAGLAGTAEGVGTNQLHAVCRLIRGSTGSPLVPYSSLTPLLTRFLLVACTQKWAKTVGALSISLTECFCISVVVYRVRLYIRPVPTAVPSSLNRAEVLQSARMNRTPGGSGMPEVEPCGLPSPSSVRNTNSAALECRCAALQGSAANPHMLAAPDSPIGPPCCHFGDE